MCGTLLACFSACTFSPLLVPCCRDTLSGAMYKACVTEAGVPETPDRNMRDCRIRLDDMPFFVPLQQIAGVAPAAAPLAEGPSTTGLVTTAATSTTATPAAPTAAATGNVTPTMTDPSCDRAVSDRPPRSKRRRSPSLLAHGRDRKVTRRSASSSMLVITAQTAAPAPAPAAAAAAASAAAAAAGCGSGSGSVSGSGAGAGVGAGAGAGAGNAAAAGTAAAAASASGSGFDSTGAGPNSQHLGWHSVCTRRWHLLH